MTEFAGPQTPLAQEIHQTKYRQTGETFRDYANRVAGALTDTPDEYQALRQLLGHQYFLPGGRIQSAIGAARRVTAANCFASGVIRDSMDSIMKRAAEAAHTMRLGGGIGYNFSRIRPSGDRITSLDSKASGPVSFMRIFDAVCQTISSAGHRRGAQMGILDISHPDIMQFIRAKRDNTSLTGFNISVGVSDEFMHCLEMNKPFALKFRGKVYEHIDPHALWDELMRQTYDWSEPGVLFFDRINRENNLYYCETIDIVNPCAEQPLSPHSVCILGSFNLTKYASPTPKGFSFDEALLLSHVSLAVRMLDNVIDRTIYPLSEQEEEAKTKRRMGIGVTGLANVGEALGYPYASATFLAWEDRLLKNLAVAAYHASVDLAIERGPFPAFDRRLLDSGFMQRMPDEVRDRVALYGLRNSHLISMAPTGTISLTADNVSGSIEPPFSLEYDRTIRVGPTESTVERVQDYAYRVWGVRGRTADEISVQDHLSVLTTAQKWVDSACSKTCNVGDHVSFKEFKQVYYDAWKGGAKGVTTFRAAGKRRGVLNKPTEILDTSVQASNVSTAFAAACFINPITGVKECA